MSEPRKLRVQPLGQHLIADLAGISPETLRDSDRIMRILKEALRREGLHCIKSVEHHFLESGAGFTGVIILAESHAAVHTYPESGYLALDIFACGSIDPACIMGPLVAKLHPETVDVQTLARAPRASASADRGT